ncbi:LysR substrate-binding domain-containing protein [Pigmentiphaga soli]
MKRHLPPLLALRFFEAAARHRSFSLAAEELHVTQSAVSRQIRTLEEALGYPLFTRSIRKVALTPRGVRYQSAVEAALDIIERASSQSPNAKRSLTVSAPQSLATFWLIPRLSEFARNYPHIDIRVTTSNEPADFERDDIDVAIRLGAMPGTPYEIDQPEVPQPLVKNWHGVHAAHLWDEVLVPVLSQKLLSQSKPLTTPADLKHYKLLHVALRPKAWTDWFRCVDARYPRNARTLEFGHFFMALEAARAGHGVALAPTIFLDGPFGANGDIVSPLPAAKKSAGAYYFLCREQLKSDRAICSFINWLRSNGQ